jgi:ankyrin repeat protein
LRCGFSTLDLAWDSVLLNHSKSKQRPKLITLFPLGEEGLEGRQFSRLHRIVLGITTICLKDDLEISTAVIDKSDNVGRTPLFWAASRGDAQSVATLLEFGANPNISCTTGTPLHAAAEGGYSDILLMLLKHGADVNSRCPELVTPLMLAAKSNDGNGCIKILLDYGADINAQDSALGFALCGASQNCLLQNCKVLLAHAPNVNLTDNEGWNALSSSVFWKDRGTTHCVQALVQFGINYHTVTQTGDGILHNAAQYVGKSTLLALIEAKLSGLGPNARNHAGKTPQDLANTRTDVDDDWHNLFRDLLQSTVVDEEMRSLAETEVRADGLDDKWVVTREIEVGYEDSDEEKFEDALKLPATSLLA